MSKSYQYNHQQTERRYCKSEVEELRIHQAKPVNWPLQHLDNYI